VGFSCTLPYDAKILAESIEATPMSPTRPIAGRPFDDELKVHYADDLDPDTAGLGLAFAPMIFRSAGGHCSLDWMMSPAEQVAMVYLLEHLQPNVAIEIGTRFGGSLQILARFCDRVYSLDIDPEVPKRLEGRFSNVEFLIGPSAENLPPLLSRLQNEGAEVGFVLVDGDHSAEGVRTDINILLKYKPLTTLYIVMHDSFNPECRRGLSTANWAGCPHVHAVELDFVAGVVNPVPSMRGQLWGGLALGILKPELRHGRFELTGRSELTYELAQEAVLHRHRRPLTKRIFNKVRRLAGTGAPFTK
jgi:Cephalosporin hydroxylase